MTQPDVPAAPGLDDFITHVVADPVLVARLLPIEDRRLFLEQTLNIAREEGYLLTREELEAAMLANRRRWIERSLPW